MPPQGAGNGSTELRRYGALDGCGTIRPRTPLPANRGSRRASALGVVRASGLLLASALADLTSNARVFRSPNLGNRRGHCSKEWRRHRVPDHTVLRAQSARVGKREVRQKPLKDRCLAI